MKKTIIILIILISLLLLGCTEPEPICGDNICEEGEEFTCSADCGNQKIEEVEKIMTWATAEPFGILDWSLDSEGLLSIVIVNNSIVDLNFKKLEINQNGLNFESENTGIVEPEGIIVLGIGVEDSFAKEGFLVFIEKENIKIEYNATGASTQTQVGIADIKIAE